MSCSSVSVRIQERPEANGEGCLCGASLVLWQRSESEIWLNNIDLRPDVLSVLGLDAWVDNDIVTYKGSVLSTCRMHSRSLPGTQLIGVVTLCLSPVCNESTTRSTSAVLRPVEAGYDKISRMVFFGSITKTLRIVKAIPLLSTLVMS